VEQFLFLEQAAGAAAVYLIMVSRAVQAAADQTITILLVQAIKVDFLQ
jgi:hypothetical protein